MANSVFDKYLRLRFQGELTHIHCTKKKFYIKDFFSNCDQIRRKLRIWSHLLKKSLMENFIFCAMLTNKNLLKISLMKPR